MGFEQNQTYNKIYFFDRFLNNVTLLVYIIYIVILFRLAPCKDHYSNNPSNKKNQPMSGRYKHLTIDVEAA